MQRIHCASILDLLTLLKNSNKFNTEIYVICIYVLSSGNPPCFTRVLHASIVCCRQCQSRVGTWYKELLSPDATRIFIIVCLRISIHLNSPTSTCACVYEGS